jgi:hypothetical protein
MDAIIFTNILFPKRLNGEYTPFLKEMRREKMFSNSENKRKIFGHKALCAAVLTLMMAISTGIAAVPMSSAQTLLDHNTYIYVVAAPNPIGLGETTYITYFLPNVPPAQLPVSAPRFGVWNGITVSITKPDGKTENMTNLSSSYAAAGTIAYTPTQKGSYIIVASFAGQTIASGSSKGQYYEPSTSPPTTLNVTDTPTPPPISYPLPSNYWTFPIEAQNQRWNIYSGNWLAGNFPNSSMSQAWNPWTEGPYSAHIMWAKEWVTGGLVGGNNEAKQYGQGRWPGGGNQYFTPFIANGILYANLPEYYLTSTGGTNQISGFEAIDLATGEVIWKNTANDSIAFMQVLNYYSTMMSGSWSYLWSTQAGTTWRMYDTLTGNLVQTITNVPTGGRVTFGPSGELCVYFISGSPRNWLAMWNSTLFEGWAEQQVGYMYGPTYAPNTVWAPPVGTYNFSLGMQWNVTIPSVSGIGFTNAFLPNDLIVCSRSISATNTTGTALEQIAFSIKPNLYPDSGGNLSGQVQVLWGPVNRTTFIDGSSYERIETASYTNSGVPVYVMYSREKLQMNAYNARTGQFMYSTQPFETVWGMFTGESNNIQAADGKLFAGGYDGTMHCYDLATGTLLWTYFVGNAGLNTAYGSWPFDGSYSYYDIAGDLVIMGANEHSPNNPTWLGGKIWAVNTTDGKLVWKISSFQYETQPMPVVGNQLLNLNFYDGKLYDFGRGPSATTVSAPQAALTSGQPVTITGTVTDQSVGAKGTPAISDDNMTAWMEYLYMQKPKPTDAKGVQVVLTAIDPNHNSLQIGTATSDSNGNYGFMWTPPVPGLYQVKATFAGTNSYWGSDATAYFSVQTAPSASPVAPAPTPTQTSTETPPTTITATPTATPSIAPSVGGNSSTALYVGIAAVAVIVAIVVVALVLRRRK